LIDDVFDFLAGNFIESLYMTNFAAIPRHRFLNIVPTIIFFELLFTKKALMVLFFSPISVVPKLKRKFN